MTNLRKFNAAHHLDNPTVIAAYLKEALETGDKNLIARAIDTIARARSMNPELKQALSNLAPAERNEFERQMTIARQIMRKDRNALRELAKR